MPHVELSLSEPAASRPRPPARSSLGRWAEAVTHAGEAGLMIDNKSVIVALSPPCHVLLNLDLPVVVPGRPHWIDDWRPEDAAFWEQTGAGIAKRTLIFSSVSVVPYLCIGSICP